MRKYSPSSPKRFKNKSKKQSQLLTALPYLLNTLLGFKLAFSFFLSFPFLPGHLIVSPQSMLAVDAQENTLPGSPENRGDSNSLLVCLVALCVRSLYHDPANREFTI